MGCDTGSIAAPTVCNRSCCFNLCAAQLVSCSLNRVKSNISRAPENIDASGNGFLKVFSSHRKATHTASIQIDTADHVTSISVPTASVAALYLE